MNATDILGLVSLLGFLVLMTPAVFGMNMARGTTLRNATIWLGIFTLLVWLYKFLH